VYAHAQDPNQTSVDEKIRSRMPSHGTDRKQDMRASSQAARTDAPSRSICPRHDSPPGPATSASSSESTGNSEDEPLPGEGLCCTFFELAPTTTVLEGLFVGDESHPLADWYPKMCTPGAALVPGEWQPSLWHSWRHASCHEVAHACAASTTRGGCLQR
jgi:hypothetical protein